MSIQTLSPFVIELLVIMYNFACKYSEFADPFKSLEVIQSELNCKIWGNASPPDLNAVVFGYVEEASPMA